MENPLWLKIDFFHMLGDLESKQLKVAALPLPKRLRAGRSKTFPPNHLSPFLKSNIFIL
jgi:hypothetical protein